MSLKDTNPPGPSASGAVVLHFGNKELFIRQRYEVISIVNDILIAVWFPIGSFELLIRPVIRLIRRTHLARLQPVVPASGGSGSEF